MDAVRLPTPIQLPSLPGSGTPALQPGQVVEALVLALLDDGWVRLGLADATIDVRTEVPLSVGTTIRLAVRGTATDLKLVILPGAAAAQSVQPGSPDPVLRSEGGAHARPAVTAPEHVALAARPDSAASRPAVPSLGEALRTAAARQGGLAPLFANLARIAAAPRIAAPIPEPLRQLAGHLLALRPTLDQKLVAADLKQALDRSGLFLEARLAGAERGPVGFPEDLKAALLVFRQVVRLWLEDVRPASPLDTLLADLGDEAPAGSQPAATRPERAPQVRPDPPPPPPYRGSPPAAQPSAAPSIADDAAPAEIAERLLAQTDAALARTTLLQVASLPDGTVRQEGARVQPHWAFEIPFATAQGTSVAQFEVSRDGHAAGPDNQPIWRARFSLDLEPMGPVHAQVTLMGERAAVSLWAERPESAARLRDNAGVLSRALREAALDPGEIQCRVGTPAAPRPATGRFLDQAS